MSSLGACVEIGVGVGVGVGVGFGGAGGPDEGHASIWMRTVHQSGTGVCKLANAGLVEMPRQEL